MGCSTRSRRKTSRPCAGRRGFRSPTRCTDAASCPTREMGGMPVPGHWQAHSRIPPRQNRNAQKQYHWEYRPTPSERATNPSGLNPGRPTRRPAKATSTCCSGAPENSIWTETTCKAWRTYRREGRSGATAPPSGCSMPQSNGKEEGTGDNLLDGLTEWMDRARGGRTLAGIRALRYQ